MSVIQKKIDFVAIITCKNANPNGDPLNGNMPRKTYKGYGEISDVCIKRKIRNRLLDMGESIFVQSDDKNVDGFKSLRERADSISELRNVKNREDFASIACKTWIDVRSFGQVFAFTSGKSGEGLSVGIRGPVSIQPAFSVEPVDITSIQITKSVSNESKDKKGSDTMGTKHRIDFGVYLLKGSINVQLAELTGFSEEDAEKIKEAVRTLFVNDSSSARPEGTMSLEKLYWFKHNSKLGQYSAAKVHNFVNVEYIADSRNAKDSVEDYSISLVKPDDLVCEVYDGV
jgi:CRISPR-associated protein Csd2